MITKKEKVSHAIGGIGHNLIYALFSGYLLIFYTDIFRLSPVFTGVLFLIARIWDAFNDPFVGLLADKTKTKYGRFRVWILAAAPVIAIALIGCFYVPDISKTLQYVYCYVTYILLGMSFTCVDIPYWTLPSVMTANAQERNEIFSFSSIFACLSSGVGAVVVPMIVSNAKDHQTGYLLCAVSFAVIGIICYVICGRNVIEHVQPENKKFSIVTALKSLVINKPLLIIMVASLFGNLAFQVKVAMNTYYGTYVLGDFGYVTYLSAMLLLGMLIGSAIVPAIIKAFGSKAAMMSVLFGGVVVGVAFYFIGYGSLVMVMVLNALAAVVIGAFTVLVNAMTADAIDYAELTLGQRNEGIITSTRTFVTKLATAIAGAAAAFALGKMNYVPNVEQAVEVKNAMHAWMSVIPGVCYGIGLLCMILYPLTKERFKKMEEALAVKRNMDNDI